MKMKPIYVALSFILTGQTWAEEITSVDTADEKPEIEETIVVTGSGIKRLMADSPQSVSAIEGFEVARLSASSQADVLRYIPGIKVEGGGGEVATNLQVRGLPSTGQYQFTPLLYDGSPTLSAFGLNSSAYDVYYRSDLGIKRVEFVRGGVSNLFGQGSVAGVINYLSNVGEDDPETSLQLEVSDHNRTRIDFATSGPVSDKGLYYALSGFYRYDEGPIDTGLPTEGYQLRGNIRKEFDDGSGHLTVYGQAIDDNVQFFLPIPLDGASQERLPGNDGQEVESLQTVRASKLAYDSADGRYESPIANGVATKGGSLSVVLEKDITDDWTVIAKAKYSNYQHQFNLFLDGDGIVNVPETQAEYLDNRNLGTVDNATFTFADSGQVVPADYLLFANRILDRDRPAEDFSTELNLTREFYLGDFTHNVTVGGFMSRTEADDDTRITRYLGEFNNEPRLVNLSVMNDNNESIVASQNGVTAPGISYTNQTATALRRAFYIADQIESDDWIIDFGARWESIDGTINKEGSQSVTISDDPLLADNLTVSTTGNGQYTYGEVSANDMAVSAAALYKLSNSINVYANASTGFFFPEIRSVQFNSLGNPGSYESEQIDQFELGIKYFSKAFSGTAALFTTDLDNRRSVSFENGPNGGIIEKSVLQSTSAKGVELVGSYKLTKTLILDANLTYQDHEFKKYGSNPDYVGNELLRKPKLLINTSIRYTGENWDAGFYHNYHGDNYANDANTVELDSFHLFRADAGYTWSLQDDQRIRASVGIFNLFDSEGVTEGSPRLGNSQTAENQYFIGRPILPRRVTFRVRYDF